MSKHSSCFSSRPQTNLDIFIHRSDEFLLTANICSSVRVTVSHQVFSSSHYVLLVTRSVNRFLIGRRWHRIVNEAGAYDSRHASIIQSCKQTAGQRQIEDSDGSTVVHSHWKYLEMHHFLTFAPRKQLSHRCWKTGNWTGSVPACE